MKNVRMQMLKQKNLIQGEKKIATQSETQCYVFW